MRTRIRTLFALPLLALSAACSDHVTGPDAELQPPASFAVSAVPEATCGDDTSVQLLAGQHIDAGTVTIQNSADSIYVTVATTGGWTISETHVAVAATVGGIPTNKSGNPQPGQFSDKASHDPAVTTFTYAFSLEDLGLEPEDAFVVAAHAVVVNGAGGSESAWGAGTRFVNRGNWATYTEASVQACAGPPPGQDVVVFNDVNIFDNDALTHPSNPLMVQNLVSYSHGGPRGSATDVWFDCGRNAGYPYACGSNMSTMVSVIQNAGYTVTNSPSTSGSLTSIPGSVKVIVLWTPMVAFTTAEINTLKQFAAEGGRIVYVGEHAGFLGAIGIAVENNFLLNMGAVMANIGQAVDCGRNNLPASSLRPHQITAGMTGVRMGCASVIVPGPDDYPLFYDSSNTLVLAGVARIDITPLPANLMASSLRLELRVTEPANLSGINPNSTTGW